MSSESAQCTCSLHLRCISIRQDARAPHAASLDTCISSNKTVQCMYAFSIRRASTLMECVRLILLCMHLSLINMSLGRRKSNANHVGSRRNVAAWFDPSASHATGVHACFLWTSGEQMMFMCLEIESSRLHMRYTLLNVFVCTLSVF